MPAKLFRLCLLLCFASAPAFAGQIFVTGHDPIWHSAFDPLPDGARDLASVGIDYARGGSSDKFLFIESKSAAIPAGNLQTVGNLTTFLGYAASEFDHYEASELNAVGDVATFLSGYSAVVVASDHGGMLTADELGFLNAHSTEILDYINAGGGLYAEAESNSTGLIGATPRFGFLPFLVSSTDFNAAETNNQVTAFGAGLGLSDDDVNGNFSHNYFASTGGMNVVDTFNGDPSRPLTLAFTGTIGTTGVPAPPAALLLLVGLAGLGLRRRSEV